jgi:hypothetical protein
MTGGDRVRAQLELSHHAAQGRVNTRGTRWTGERFSEPESIPPALWVDAYENGWGAAFVRIREFQRPEFRRADLLALYPVFPAS